MNFYQILKNNFLQFRLIFLSITATLMLLIYFSYNSYLNTNISINKVKIQLYGNFSHIVFNNLSQPIFQRYKNNKIYLLSNKTTNDFARVYDVFYLYNIENQKFFNKWKNDLERNFLSSIEYRYSKNYFDLNLPEKFDLVKLSKILKDVNLFIEELDKQLILQQNLGNNNKVKNLNGDKNFYFKQKFFLEKILNSKIIITENEKTILYSKNKYSFIVELFFFLIFYFFANLYLSTFLKKIE